MISLWITASVFAYHFITKLERREGRNPNKIFFIVWACLGPAALTVATIMWIIYVTEEKKKSAWNENDAQILINALKNTENEI